MVSLPTADLLSHPLASPAWEQAPAARTRPGCRAVWAGRESGEADAPTRRIIHVRSVHSDEPMTLERLLARAAAGYHKCASGPETDRPAHLRLAVAEGAAWRTLLDAQVDDGPREVAFDLGGVTATAARIELRRARVDGWWPSWNLATSCLRLEGRLPPPWTPPPQAWLDVDGVDLGGLPHGVSAEHRSGEVRFATPHLEVGFRLRVPALAFLGVDDDGAHRTGRDLLQQPRSMDIVRAGLYPAGVYPVLRDQQAAYLANGPRLTRHDGRAPVGFLGFDFAGSTRVEGASVHYQVEMPASGQRYDLTWTVHADRLELRAERVATADLRAWSSSAWHFPTDNRVTPSCVLGRITQEGETGLVEGPFAWHFPRHGALRVAAAGPALWRSDSVRSLDTNTLELKLGETPQPEGDYVLRGGRHTAEVTFAVGAPELAAVRQDAPAAVRRMVARHALTALPFRPDTSTYSNNGASMHCTTTLNDLSAISLRLGEPAPGVVPLDLLRRSLERWLGDAPAYGSGWTSRGGHHLEDEYVHLGADTLLGLARFLGRADPAWAAEHRGAIAGALERMRRRDGDGDGLVESTIRRGVSGEHQWSTAWSDVLSFGHKDAWANAVLYEALRTLATTLPRAGLVGLADGLDAWADGLRERYLPTFLNPATGWIGGWRSADDRLHDHGFWVVNGAACATDLVPVDDGRRILTALWEETRRVGYDDLRNGLPFNLRRIPEEDIGGVVFGLPLGGYLQGGASHHRLGPVVTALRRVGMEPEADRLLEALATTIADDSAFGGVGSGRDWRMWDGTPSGYEGQLAEGFSVLAAALDRWGDDPPPAAS
jgi:hypothetical protein